MSRKYTEPAAKSGSPWNFVSGTSMPCLEKGLDYLHFSFRLAPDGPLRIHPQIGLGFTIFHPWSDLPVSLGVKRMFDRIAGRYDLLNHFLSLGRDLAWRRQAIRLWVNWARPGSSPLRVLDLCGGTGDFLKALKQSGISVEMAVVGDFSFPMLQRAKGKLHRDSISSKANVAMVQMDALVPSFRPGTFDLILCGYGMRNLDSLPMGLDRIRGLLKQGGFFVTLEFFRPTSRFTRFFYHRLAPIFIPALGSVLAGQKLAYAYLVHSVRAFSSVEEYQSLAQEKGFGEARIEACDFGISHIIALRKP